MTRDQLKAGLLLLGFKQNFYDKNQFGKMIKGELIRVKIGKGKHSSIAYTSLNKAKQTNQKNHHLQVYQTTVNKLKEFTDNDNKSTESDASYLGF